MIARNFQLILLMTALETVFSSCAAAEVASDLILSTSAACSKGDFSRLFDLAACARAVGVAGNGDLCAVRGGVEEVVCVGAKDAGQLGLRGNGGHGGACCGGEPRSASAPQQYPRSARHARHPRECGRR